ncbi:MAG: hypothetical protein ABFS32_23050 [Bacteroidota bacterium]
MEDNGNLWYYLALGIIYLISRLFGKKKKKPVTKRPVQERDIEAPTAEKRSEPELTFEDILRELSGTKEPKPVPAPQPEPPIEFGQDFEPKKGHYSVDEIDEIAVPLEVPPDFGSNTSKRYPEPDTLKTKRPKDEFKRAEHYKIRDKEEIDFVNMLNEQDGPARAFVMSEIFNKKYE